MPSSKILSILILCLGAVVSVWLFSGQSKTQNTSNSNENGTSVVAAIQTEEDSSEDWKKILSSVDKKDQKVTNLVTNSQIKEDDTTLTDQLSRDFMSQYLLAVKSNGEISKETAAVIALNSLSLPEYNQKAVVYIKQNLKTTSKSDKETMRKYEQKINQGLQGIYYSLNDNPAIVFVNAMQSEDPKELKKLDPIIKVTKDEIKYLLDIEVPETAVDIHLKLLNISSKVLFDLESMKIVLDDPVKAFPSIGSYTENSNQFKNVILEMDLFLQKVAS